MAAICGYVNHNKLKKSLIIFSASILGLILKIEKKTHATKYEIKFYWV